jgi:hypothetical protein
VKYDIVEFMENYGWQHAFNEAVNGQCLDTYNPETDERNFGPVANVAEVYAASEGENDGAIWICVCRMDDGRFAVMRAGCDYTGWDCQASGTMEYFGSLELAVSKLTLTAEEIERLRADIEERGIHTDW